MKDQKQNNDNNYIINGPKNKVKSSRTVYDDVIIKKRTVKNLLNRTNISTDKKIHSNISSKKVKNQNVFKYPK